MVKRKCVRGWPCGNTCITRKKKCRSNLNEEGKKLIETYTEYINRLQEFKKITELPKPQDINRLDSQDVLKSLNLKEGQRVGIDEIRNRLPINEKEDQDKLIRRIIEEDYIQGHGYNPRALNSPEKANSPIEFSIYIEEIGETLDVRIDAVEITSKGEKLLKNPGILRNPVNPDYQKNTTSRHIQKEREELLKNSLGEENFNGITNAIRKELKNFEPIIYISDFTVERIKNQPEQRIKTQFETDTSGGRLDTTKRKQAEENLFGYPQNTTNVVNRPIYTAFQRKPTKYDNTFVQYGDKAFRVNVPRNQITTMFGDSLGAHNQGIDPEDLGNGGATNPDNFSLSSIMSGIFVIENKLKEDIKEDLKNKNYKNIANKIIDYYNSDGRFIEAQIHTPVTLNMLEEIGSYKPPNREGILRNNRRVRELLSEIE